MLRCSRGKLMMCETMATGLSAENVAMKGSLLKNCHLRSRFITFMCGIYRIMSMSVFTIFANIIKLNLGLSFSIR